MRADVYIFNTGNAKSRQSAKLLIEGGNVLVDGKILTKASLNIDESSEHTVEIINKPMFVSRGGEKLDHAIRLFNINVADLACIDIGASTGGFTDCLLQNGARVVYCVDSGQNQLDPKIENDKRVVSIEKFNARFMSKEDFPFCFDLAVMDVSFISQTMLHSAIGSVLRNGGDFISLIKPQFECGKGALNSKGIVKNKSYHLQAITRVIDSALLQGFSCIDLTRSPIEGGSGNIEFLAHFKKTDNPECLIHQDKIKQTVQSK